MRPHQIYGKILTTFQIQYNGHYFPNSCIQCNLFITLLFQLEFILGLGSEFKSEGPRIWHGQDFCKELPVSFASCEESDSEESYTCNKKFVIFWLFIYYNTYWIQYFLLWRQCFFYIKLCYEKLRFLCHADNAVLPFSDWSSNLESHPFISSLLRSERLRMGREKTPLRALGRTRLCVCRDVGKNHLDSVHRPPLKCLEPSTASTEPSKSLPAKIEADLPTKS